MSRSASASERRHGSRKVASAPAHPRRQVDERILARRREVATGRARRRRRVTLSVAAALVAAATGVALTYTPLLAVHDVAVRGVDGERAEAVRAAAAVRTGERIVAVDLARVRVDVESLPWVRTADVGRVPPSTVSVAVTERLPEVVVHVAGEAWLLDRDGVVVAGGTREGLPVVEAPNSVLPGPGAPVADAAVRNALAAHRDLPAEVAEAVARYDAPSERGLRVLLTGLEGVGPDGVWVRLGLAERVEAKGRVVLLLLARAEEAAGVEGGIAELDVRAPDNPVLVPRS